MGLTEDIAALKKSHEDATTAITSRLEKSDETTGALIGLVEKLTGRVEALATGNKEGEDKTPDAATAVKKLGEVCDALDAMDKTTTELAKSVKALAQGGSSQGAEPDEIKKTGDPDRDFALALLG